MVSLKKRKITALAPAIPTDIMEEEILIRLPVKSKVRFRSVCKWWNSLFSDPKFIQNSFNHSCYIHGEEEDNDDYLIVCNRTGDACSRSLSILSNRNLLESSINKLPYCFPSKFEDNISLIGSIDGLVCIADYKNCEFILWNPAIHWFNKILPLPDKEIMSCITWDSMFNKELRASAPPKEICMSHMLGFGWDSLAEDYKIIAKPVHSLTSFVYSCKTCSWSNHKLLDYNVYNYLDHQRPFPCVIVRGIPYWKTGCGGVEKYDVTNNKFNSVDVTSINRNFNLVNLNDCLALVKYETCRLVDVYRFDEQNSSWRKLYRVDSVIKRHITMSFKYGGELVHNGINTLYDPKSKEIKSLHCRLGTELVHGFNYTPTMLALEGMKPFRTSQKLDDGLASYFDDNCLVEM